MPSLRDWMATDSALRFLCLRSKAKGSLWRPLRTSLRLLLQRGFDFEAPGFEERLGNVFRVLVAAGPLAQTRGAQILVRREFVFAHYLLELGDGGDDRADGLGLAPVGISATLRHEQTFPTKGDEIYRLLYLYDSPETIGIQGKTQPSA